METTLNIRVDILNQITQAARLNGISGSEMIIYLMQKILCDMGDPDRIGKMVQYQSRCPPEEWHIFHIQLREDMYEYCQYLRKLLKMSVSLILSYAVKKYITRHGKLIYTDNYRYKNYIIEKDIIDNIIIWKFIWGYPSNLKKILNL